VITPAKPWLLCLNFNREFVTAGRPLHADSAALAAAHARTLLCGAREQDWTIAHIRTGRARLANTDQFECPIEGLEPLPTEPVFLVRQKSALAHATLRARLSSGRPSAIYIAGFALAHQGLATLFDAHDLGLHARIVTDAGASHAIGDRTSAEIDRAVLAIAASLGGVVTTTEALSTASNVVVGFKEA
jgi:nicotinamidase-related amidase